jgi:hypothetical protein
MGNTRENRFTVHQRLAASEARLTALEQENATLRAWVSGTVASQINDAANTIQSAQAADFRELQASIRIPRDGVDGKDGATGAQGDKGEAGDVTVIGDTELAKEVIKLRIALKRRHAAQIASIVDRIETLKKPEHQTHTYRILSNNLEGILRDIEMLQRLP